MSIDKTRVLIWGGVTIVAIGMGVSAPAAATQDWLAVLSYLSITAAGLMMVITGVSQRNAAQSRANHAEMMASQSAIREQLEAQAEETARLRPLVELVNRHQLQLAEQGRSLSDQGARLAALEEWRATVDAELSKQKRLDQRRTHRGAPKRGGRVPAPSEQSPAAQEGDRSNVVNLPRPPSARHIDALKRIAKRIVDDPEE